LQLTNAIGFNMFLIFSSSPAPLFSHRGGICIADSLAFNNTITHLDLTENSLGPEAALQFGQMIANQVISPSISSCPL
jgi:hypothetical protein